MGLPFTGDAVEAQFSSECYSQTKVRLPAAAAVPRALDNTAWLIPRGAARSICPRVFCLTDLSARQGEDYRGTQGRSRSGKTCVAWDDHSRFNHETRNTPTLKPRAGLSDGSYCRGLERTGFWDSLQPPGPLPDLLHRLPFLTAFLPSRTPG